MPLGNCQQCGKKGTVIVRICTKCGQNCCAHCKPKIQGGKCLNCGKVGSKPA